MPLDIHPGLMKRLSEIINNGLGRLTVEKRSCPSSKFYTLKLAKAADDILPQHGKLREALNAYLGDSPVEEFIYQTLWRELSERQMYDATAPTVGLSELPGYGEVQETTDRLLREFASLPWQYALSLPLPEPIGGALRSVGDYAISEDMRLVVPNDAFSTEFSLTSGIEDRDSSISRDLDENAGSAFGYYAGYSSLASSQQNFFLSQSVRKSPIWDSATAHLQIFVKGFIGVFGLTTPARDAIDSVKAFLGIGIALRLFRVNASLRSASPKTRLRVHRRVESGWIVERTLELDASVSGCLHDLVLDDHYGSLKSESDHIAWRKAVLPGLACAFSASDQAKRLALGGQWLFDSYCGTNELLSFVQAAVVMEILLGDKAPSDLMGLGELLRNRCAYLISETNEEREMILRDFVNIYNVRSKIVHTGKKRLNLEEFRLFDKLRWLCRRVILKEIELIEKEKSQGDE
jgi:hypothetical protein